MVTTNMKKDFNILSTDTTDTLLLVDDVLKSFCNEYIEIYQFDSAYFF